jgi:adenylate kinase
MGKVIYLTGAPATGKSTLCAALAQSVNGLEFYSYSALLRDVVNRRTQARVDETGIREKSASIITRDDVAEVDERLIAEIALKRQDRHVVIDSHPVTKEEFGFRITPFTPDQLKKLNPDIVVCAFADPQVLADRIRRHPAGRPLPSDFEIALHVQLQGSLAVQYGFLLGCACYLLDTGAPLETVKQRFLDITKIV